MSPVTRRDFLKAAALGAISFAALYGGVRLFNFLTSRSKEEETEPIPEPAEPTPEPAEPTPVPRPMPANAEIKQSIDDLLAVGDEMVYDNGMDHRAEVLDLASKVYQTLNDGRTLEQDNPIIKFLTNEEWVRKTSTPYRVRQRSALGFLAWESVGNNKDGELIMYIRGNSPVWLALRSVDHEAGIGYAKRKDGPRFDFGDANWYHARMESAGYLSEVAFLRKMEEAGLEETRYANTEENITYIKQILESITLKQILEAGIWKNSEKDAFFDAEGQLKADDTTDIMLGEWYGAAMFALDPSLADVKKRIELQGRTTPEENMMLIKRIMGTTTDTFRDHYKSLLNAETYDYVRDWTVQLLTSPERLNGSRLAWEKTYLYPADVLP